jgi:hypothetical protein
MKTELISSVDKVTLSIEKSNPPILVVTAVGTASSGSHQKPKLERRIYVVFPADGIQEYNFNIDVPEGSATTDIKEHTVQDSWPGFPENDLRGVRVFSKMKALEELLEVNKKV